MQEGEKEGGREDSVHRETADATCACALSCVRAAQRRPRPPAARHPPFRPSVRHHADIQPAAPAAAAGRGPEQFGKAEAKSGFPLPTTTTRRDALLSSGGPRETGQGHLSNRPSVVRRRASYVMEREGKKKMSERRSNG